MRNVNVKQLIIIGLVAILFSSCAGLQKMKKNADQIQFNVTPEVLESHANKVDVAIDGRFPAKYFNKKATIIATPVLTYEGGETAFESLTIQGENVEANSKVISYENGGNFSYKDFTGFNDVMSISDLELRIKAVQGKKSIDFDPIKIADGVIATSNLLVNFPKPILGVEREENNTGKYDPNIDEFQRVVPDEMIADIHYLINSAKLSKDETRSDDVRNIKKYTKDAFDADRKNLKNVEILAYASPDGELEHNADLAENRQETSTEYFDKELKNAGIETNLKAKYTPEDWDGFRELMEKSNIQDKELILRVLSMYTDPEVREREIKNLSAAFTDVADDILPRLRRAKIITSIDLIGKTDEEITALAASDGSSLNPAELLYAASLTEDLDKKLAIYNAFSKAYPRDWRGPNNAGYVLAKQFKFEEAKPLFERAETLKNSEAIIKNNLGAVAIFEEEIQQAEELLGAAAGAGNEVNYNLGMVSVKNADYDQAVRFFSKDADYNTALAKILTGDNNGALKDLENFDAPKCYMKPYLTAIIGANTAKEALLFNNLAKAVEMNPKLKAKAAKDMNFAKYFADPKFKAIIE